MDEDQGRCDEGEAAVMTDFSNTNEGRASAARAKRRQQRDVVNYTPLMDLASVVRSNGFWRVEDKSLKETLIHIEKRMIRLAEMSQNAKTRASIKWLGSWQRQINDEIEIRRRQGSL